MATKKKTGRFSALIRYTVEVDVPLSSATFADAVLEAEEMKPHKLYGNNYQVFEYGDPVVNSVSRCD